MNPGETKLIWVLLGRNLCPSILLSAWVLGPIRFELFFYPFRQFPVEGGKGREGRHVRPAILEKTVEPKSQIKKEIVE